MSSINVLRYLEEIRQASEKLLQEKKDIIQSLCPDKKDISVTKDTMVILNPVYKDMQLPSWVKFNEFVAEGEVIVMNDPSPMEYRYGYLQGGIND